MYAFLWDDLSDQENESFYLTELSKFKDNCDLAIKSTVYDLSSVK